MRVILSAAVSLDGYTDDCSPSRLKLSGPEDWAEVVALRTRCDAILVGAGTVRADNPSLVVKDEAAKHLRLQAGMETEPAKVTVTCSGNIPPDCDFFVKGEGKKIVFATRKTPAEKIAALREVAHVYVEECIDPQVITDRLRSLGYNTLMVEGGSGVMGMFIRGDRFDALRLAVAPFFVGDGNAPRFVPSGSYPWDKDHRLQLRTLDRLGETSVMWLTPQETCHRDKHFLSEVVEQSLNSPPCDTSYRVGAVVVTADGRHFHGFTHETGPGDHAEEVAVAKAEAAGCRLAGATMYSSMEPCTHRRSKPISCSDLLIRKGFSKVVYALAEPSALAPCEGRARLKAAGLEVVRDDSFDDRVMQINSHILDGC